MITRAFGMVLAATLAVPLLATGSFPAGAEPRIGEAAPAFASVDSDGNAVKFADHKGKTLVLEWANDSCSHTRRHYSSNYIQELQKKWTGDGVVWLKILSAAQGEPGYLTPERANAVTINHNAAPTAVLMDSNKEMARLYAVSAIPAMFVIAGNGTLAYMGPIDDSKARGRARNVFDRVMTEMKTGKPVSTPIVKSAAGCPIDPPPQPGRRRR